MQSGLQTATRYHACQIVQRSLCIRSDAMVALRIPGKPRWFVWRWTQIYNLDQNLDTARSLKTQPKARSSNRNPGRDFIRNRTPFLSSDDPGVQFPECFGAIATHEAPTESTSRLLV